MAKQLWKRVKQDSLFALHTTDNTEFLDLQEQEAIVQSLEIDNRKQSIIWRGTFAFIAGSFGIFFLVSAYWQAWSPWETRYHSYFMEDVRSTTVVVADICAAVVYSSIALGIVSDSYRQLLWFSLVPGCMLAIFWFIQMLRLSRMHWDVVWLPLGPCGFAGLCLYVKHGLEESTEGIKRLRDSMYHFKKV